MGIDDAVPILPVPVALLHVWLVVMAMLGPQHCLPLSRHRHAPAGGPKYELPWTIGQGRTHSSRVSDQGKHKRKKCGPLGICCPYDKAYGIAPPHLAWHSQLSRARMAWSDFGRLSWERTCGLRFTLQCSQIMRHSGYHMWGKAEVFWIGF